MGYSAKLQWYQYPPEFDAKRGAWLPERPFVEEDVGRVRGRSLERKAFIAVFSKALLAVSAAICLLHSDVVVGLE